MTHRIIVALLLLLPSTSFATSLCEADINAAFSQTPDVEDMVSDQIPMNDLSIRLAYEHGLFPWSVTPEGNARWFAPIERGVMLLDDSIAMTGHTLYKTKRDKLEVPPEPEVLLPISITTSDKKAIRKMVADPNFQGSFDEAVEIIMNGGGKFRVTFDQAFERVMRECKDQDRYVQKKDKDGNPEFDAEGKKVMIPGTGWITEEHIQQYTELNRQGLAHSVEIWLGDELVAGNYGVFFGGYYSGESMFRKMNDVAKLALVAITYRLQRNGHHFMDTQQVVPGSLSHNYGAKYISREDFKYLLHQAKLENLPF